MEKFKLLNLKPLSRIHRGYTLIEFILGLALISILLGSFFTIINFSGRAVECVEFEDKLYLNGRFGIEYLKEEIKSMNKIIDSEKISQLDSTYPDNIGFVLMSDSEIVDSEERYKFVTYYLNWNNEVIRITKSSPDDIYPIAGNFSGYNVVCKNVLSFNETHVDKDKELIRLSLNMGEGRVSLNLKSLIYADLEYDF
jgi:prepilin-type N-terminal cleavage/methylation domain-containing protein